MSKLAVPPSFTSPASPTVSTGTSAPGFGLLGSVLSRSTMVAEPLSVMPAGSGVPLAVCPLRVAFRLKFSRPSNTPSSTVGTLTTSPPVVPAGTVRL
ncbi:hypothetical protein [Pectobacterium sp. B1J-3]|uniref:hypothetical protein n=1 Tax=Pectobacterium sp. B1J-3 TaxID=3385371 RepID=UPI003905EDAD